MNRGGTGTQLNQYTQTANPAEYFCYDADGNLIADGKPTSDCNTANGAWAYTWDGENRLIRVEPAGTPASGDKKLEFQYDYRSRRVRKTSYTHNGSAWIEDADLLFVYDDWNVVLVLDANDSNAVDRKSTWGLDLSGLSGNESVSGIHNAGGIGGLLAIEDVNAGGGSANSYWYFYDANGNVGQLIKASDRSLAAHYEYDPYGNTITATGPYSAANPWRFSTKWHDTELPGNVLIYYGYRYYNPRLGRWMNWDPIEEAGGLNLYESFGNAPTSRIDPDGRALIWSCAVCACCAGAAGISCAILCADGSGWDNPADGYLGCFSKCLQAVPGASGTFDTACYAACTACAFKGITKPTPKPPKKVPWEVIKK